MPSLYVIVENIERKPIFIVTSISRSQNNEKEGKKIFLKKIIVSSGKSSSGVTKNRIFIIIYLNKLNLRLTYVKITFESARNSKILSFSTVFRRQNKIICSLFMCLFIFDGCVVLLSLLDFFIHQSPAIIFILITHCQSVIILTSS